MKKEIFCLGVSHHEAPVEIREKLALPVEKLGATYKWFQKQPGIEGAVVLSTCNRVEFYLSLSGPGKEQAASFLPHFFRDMQMDYGSALNLLFVRRGAEAVEHLFKIAAGLDSMVVGETEIFGQVKQAYREAQNYGPLPKELHRLFQSAFHAGKKVRHETEITRGSVSVGSTAVELAAQIFGNLNGRHAVLVGAGDTAERTARSLISRGLKSLVVTNRTHQHALDLAAMLGARAIEFDQWHEEFLTVDIVISSTSAPHLVLSHEVFMPLIHQRGSRPLFLIDLAVPRDIDPRFAGQDDVYLYNIDDLQMIADRHLLERRTAILRGEELVEACVAEFMPWLESFDQEKQLAEPQGEWSEAGG